MPTLVRLPALHATLAALVLATACGSGAPKPAAVAGPAPDSFRVVFETSRGPFTVEAIRAWSPNGADRFYQLVSDGFYDENRFYRVVPGFVAQFGLNDARSRNEHWDALPLTDDSVRQHNLRGTVAFTNSGPNTRSHQMFVNLADNARLDPLKFAPFGRVVDGMAVVDSLYSGYEEEPEQQMIRTLGNSYLTRMFPKLDYIKTARLEHK